MLGIHYIKTNPTDFVLLFRSGKLRKSGSGLSFFYYAPSSSVVIVPAASKDTPFIFNESTNDFQSIAIQGQITYRVSDPAKLATMLDFTVDRNGHYTGDGMEVLPVRLTNLVQITVREKITNLNLKEALAAASDIVNHVHEKLKNSEQMKLLGLDLVDFSILKISPTPEISRALESTAREELLKAADQAVYERRNFAVEQERIIKENELQTQISVEEKNRLIREEQMNAELAVQEKTRMLEDAKMESLRSIESKKNQIELEKLTSHIDHENRKKELVRAEAENMKELSRARAESLREELSSISTLPPELLEVLASNQMDASKIVGRALRDLAKNADKIGTLQISPDLLTSLLNEKPKK